MVSRRALLGRTALALAASRFLSPVTAIAVQPQPYADGDPFMLGVASGRSVTRSPPLSLKAYISFCTMSVVSPVPFAKSSSRSMTGVRSSTYP